MVKKIVLPLRKKMFAFDKAPPPPCRLFMYWYNTCICGTALSVTFNSLRNNLRISLINCLVLGLTSCSCGSFISEVSIYFLPSIPWYQNKLPQKEHGFILNRPPPLDFTGNVANIGDFDVFVSAAHPKADKKHAVIFY